MPKINITSTVGEERALELVDIIDENVALHATIKTDLEEDALDFAWTWAEQTWWRRLNHTKSGQSRYDRLESVTDVCYSSSYSRALFMKYDNSDELTDVNTYFFYHSNAIEWIRIKKAILNCVKLGQPISIGAHEAAYILESYDDLIKLQTQIKTFRTK